MNTVSALAPPPPSLSQHRLSAVVFSRVYRRRPRLFYQPVLKAGVAMAGGGGDDSGKSGDEPEGKDTTGATATTHERYALNVIPTEARAGFDVRIDPNTPTEDFKARLAGWCKEEGVSWELADWTTPLHEHYLTSVDREENPWWGVFLVSPFFGWLCVRLLLPRGGGGSIACAPRGPRCCALKL